MDRVRVKLIVRESVRVRFRVKDRLGLMLGSGTWIALGFRFGLE